MYFVLCSLLPPCTQSLAEGCHFSSVHTCLLMGGCLICFLFNIVGSLPLMRMFLWFGARCPINPRIQLNQKLSGLHKYIIHYPFSCLRFKFTCVAYFVTLLIFLQVRKKKKNRWLSHSLTDHHCMYNSTEDP